MMRESAIALVMRNVEFLVADVRRQHDPAAALGVPPHITLLYPWRVPPISAADLQAVEAILRGVTPYSITFRALGRFERVLFLQPDDAGETAALTRQLAASFPEHPPYGGRFGTSIPHLTVAEVTGDLGPAIDEHAARLLQALPFEVEIGAVSVLESGEDGRWAVRATLPLIG